MDRPAAPLKIALPSLLGGAIVLLLPSFLFGPLAIDSALLNAIWTEGFARGLHEGQLYPRWLAGSFEGLGAPTFYFYPPIAFYLAGGLHAAGLSIGAAINGAALVGLFGSGLAMYAFLRVRGGPALLGAMAYMAAPYHLTDFYVRAALAEFTSFIWLPLIALGLEAWPKRWAAPLLAVSYAGLCMTHLPMALLTGLFLILPLVAWKTRLGRDLPRLATYALAGLAALALAAVYLAPALTLERFISSTVLQTPFYQPDSWSLITRRGPVPPALLGWPLLLALAAVLVAAGAAASAWRRRQADVLVYAGIAFVAAVMGLALIPFVWRLPFLERVQFPWRLFEVMEFAAIAAAAASTEPISRFGRFGAAVAVSGWARIALIFVQTAGQYALPADMLQRMSDAPEYLPAGYPVAGFDEHHRDADLAAFRGPEAAGPVVAATPQPGAGLDVTTRAAGRVTLRRFAFPGWTVVSQGRAGVPVTQLPPGQLLTFDAPGPGRYELRRTRLPQEDIGLALALLGAALTAALASRVFTRVIGGLAGRTIPKTGDSRSATG